MFELIAAGVVILIAFAVVSAVLGMLSLVAWLLFLPFQILGWVIRGLGFLLLLPLLLPILVLALVFGGLGLVLGLLPALPVVLLALGIVWLARRRPTARPA